MSEAMRILQVVTSLERGGIETMLMNYYRHINREKVQFDFLVHRQKRASYDDEVEALGGKIYRLPKLNPIGITYKKALRDFFVKHSDYQIVHSHLNCLSSVILKEAKKEGIPVRIAHSHNAAQDKDLKYPMKIICRRYIPRYATHLLACGQKAGEWLFGNHQFQILNNAIETEMYKYDVQVRKNMRERLNIAKDTVLIGHVGMFSPQKNHSFLIDVFNEIQKKINAKLILVGDGKTKVQNESKVKELGLAEKVIFAGTRSDVPELMQAMDVFVFPSLYEGFPLSVVEAQAAGLPCAISDRVTEECVLTELVQRISLNKDANVWADATIEMVRSIRREASENMNISKFDVTANTEKLTSFYLRLTNEETNASFRRE